MSIEQFAEYLVSNIAKESDLVKEKKFETEEGNILEMFVSEKDMPRVIGRQGVVANEVLRLLFKQKLTMMELKI